MKEILPILFGIAILAFQMYVKNRDKAKVADLSDEKQNRPQSQEESDDVSLESFMENFFGEQKQQIVNEEHEQEDFAYQTIESDYAKTEELEQQTQPIDSWDDSRDPLEESIEYSATSIHTRDLASERTDNAEKTIDNQEYNQDFDLEKAVIYDAILNRPYS